MALRHWILTLIILSSVGVTANAKEAVRYILAPRAMVSDPTPHPQSPSDREFDNLFKQAFERALPGGHRPLGDTEDQISPDDPTLIVLPRVTAFRAYKDTLVGAVDSYRVVVVGDISLLDPWSMSRLYSATRMVEAEAQVPSQTDDAGRNRALNATFQRATQAWMDECLGQIKRSAHPFTLEARLVESPPRGLSRKHAIWPFGAMAGVQKGKPVMGLHGGRLRVLEVFDGFSVVEVTRVPTRGAEADEIYSLLLVQGDQNARTEPRLSLKWRGDRQPMPPEGDLGGPLPRGAWLGLAASYLSKEGRFRVLPIEEAEQGQARQVWIELVDLVRRKSQQARGDSGIIEQDTLRSQASQNPDLEVEVGVLDAYHGTRPTAQGGVEHLYRAIWGLTWSLRADQGEGYRFGGFEKQVEATATLTKEGLREQDGASRWFNVCRNGLVNLIQQEGKKIPQPPPRAQGEMAMAANWMRGEVLADGRVQWTQAPPQPGTDLLHRRRRGEVVFQGRSLGHYLEPRGSFKASTLAERSLDPGDELIFSPRREGARPLIYVGRPEVVGGPQSWLASADWLQVMLAKETRAAFAVEVSLVDSMVEPSACRFLALSATATPPSVETPELLLQSTWRLRLYEGFPSKRMAFPEGLPVLFRVGRQRKERFRQAAGLPMSPPNMGLPSLMAQEMGLQDLITNAKTTGLEQAITKE